MRLLECGEGVESEAFGTVASVPDNLKERACLQSFMIA